MRQKNKYDQFRTHKNIVSFKKYSKNHFKRSRANRVILNVIIEKKVTKAHTKTGNVQRIVKFSWELWMAVVSMSVNGKDVKEKIPDNTLLVNFLRETLKLTGTHIGCDTSQCGACVVHVNEKSIKSCTVLAAQLDGAKVTTIEGLANGAVLHPMQQAFHENHGLQCGFCTPGMIMSAVELVKKNKNLSEKEIRKGIEGNLCRCTGYHNIVKSIQAAALKMCPKETRVRPFNG